MNRVYNTTDAIAILRKYLQGNVLLFLTGLFVQRSSIVQEKYQDK